jgi:hypothetical protein
MTLSRKSRRARPEPRKIVMVRTELTPTNQWPSNLATCPRRETTPRQPMAIARYIRLVSFVASQSRIVSAAITQNAAVLAIPRTPTTVALVTTIELAQRQLIADPVVGIG